MRGKFNNTKKTRCFKIEATRRVNKVNVKVNVNKANVKVDVNKRSKTSSTTSSLFIAIAEETREEVP